MLAEYADCPYRVVGLQGTYCGRRPGTTVYSDNFETATGWTTNPNGTDTATTGAVGARRPGRHHLAAAPSSSAPPTAAPTTW